MASPVSQLGVWNGDIDTLACALLERMYYCKVDGVFLAPPLPDRDTVYSRLSEFRRLLLRNIVRPTPMTVPEVVDTYRGRKYVIYKAAMANMDGKCTRYHSQSVAFVKLEKGNPTKPPRCIQPRKPEYNLCVGKYIKPLEHRVYKAIKKVWGDGPTVMKGYNVAQVARIMRGKWRSFADPVGIGLDAIKFDVHVSKPVLEWEHDVYLDVYRRPSELRKLLRWQVNNVGRGYCENGKLKYKVVGRRFSGDMNTALGNCTDMCGMVWTYAQLRKVPCKLVNNGDDCVVFMERKHVKRFSEGLSEWFLDMGFRMTMEAPVDVFERIEFCQMKPMWNGEEYIMVRNVHTSLAKDTMSTIDLCTADIMEKWLHVVGEGGISLTAGVPIVQEFYQCYIRNGNGRKSALLNAVQMQTGLRLMSQGMVGEYRPVTDAARYSAYLAWDITPDEQIVMEDYFRTLHIGWNAPSDIDAPNLYTNQIIDELSLPR